jgi:hypothetical protein
VRVKGEWHMSEKDLALELCMIVAQNLLWFLISITTLFVMTVI